MDLARKYVPRGYFWSGANRKFVKKRQGPFRGCFWAHRWITPFVRLPIYCRFGISFTIKRQQKALKNQKVF